MGGIAPGRRGLPFLGEAMALGADAFVFARSRAEKHGPVVRSHLLGKDLYLLSGPDTVDAFLDEANVLRAGGLPPHAAALFGDGVVNQIDGEAHRVRKQHLMRAVDHEALAAYLPDFRRRVRERLATWRGRGEVSLQAEAPLLGMSLILGCIQGEQASDAELARLVAGYNDMGSALVGLPLPLPGTALYRARRFCAGRVEQLVPLAEARRATPTGDGVSRLASSVVDGQQLAPRDIALEVNHMFFAAGGVWAWFAGAIQSLAADPALCAALRTAAKALPDEPDGRAYHEVPGLMDFVREVKRVYDVIPVTAFGIAQRDMEVAGYTIPKGAMVTWLTVGSHTIPGIAPYADPDRFDPGRYVRGEGSAPNHFVPQGPGEALTSHRCAGVEYSTLVVMVFVVELLRTGSFAVPDQDLTRDSRSIPPTWKGGMRVRFQDAG